MIPFDRRLLSFLSSILILQYFGHLMWRALIEKDPDAGKDWRQEQKRAPEDEMVGWCHWLNGHVFEQIWDSKDREAWYAAVHGVTKSQVWLSNWTTTILIVVYVNKSGLHYIKNLSLQNTWAPTGRKSLLSCYRSLFYIII